MEVDKDEESDAEPKTTPLLSSMKKKKSDKSDEFQDVRPKKNKQKNERKSIDIFVCDESEKSATTKLKIALLYMDKLLSCKASTQRRSPPVSSSPVYHQPLGDGHLWFSIQVKHDKAEKVIKCIERGNLSSWNIVATRYSTGDEEYTFPEDPRHGSHCG